VRLSNLEKPYWPEQGITKGDLLRYYREVAPALLPHLRNRPFTMKRYPDGWRGQPFFRKNVANYAPAWIKRVPVSVSSRGAPRESRTIEVPAVNDELALLWMVNTGCIECHTWFSRIDKLERPDWVVFDLDPSSDVEFAKTVEVALLVKEALDAFKLASFLKTSGADGLHVLVPIERRHTYEDTRRFATHVARTIAAEHGELATTEWSKAKRHGVLIDASQNAKGKSIASVYSVRPMPNAPVSTPLHWDEVNDKLDPSNFTMAAVLDRPTATATSTRACSRRSSVSGPYPDRRRDVVRIDDVRAVAITLPRSSEAVVRGRLKFRIGRIVYLAFSRDETVMGFAFPKELRNALVESEPEKFSLPGQSDLRYNWVHVRLAAIDADEMRDLVEDAWAFVVPKYVVDDYRASLKVRSEADP
jgi:bifunctional non-homologous end joining protein LigD